MNVLTMMKSESVKNNRQKITNTAELLEAIARLEQKKEEQEVELHQKYREVIHDLKPQNILKNTFFKFQSSSPLVQGLFRIALGLGTGYLSKKMITKGSASTFKNLLGTLFEYGIAGLIATGGTKNEQNGLLSKVSNFLNKLSLSRKKHSD